MDRLKVLQIVWAAMLGGVVAFATAAYVALTVLDVEMGGLPPAVLRVVAPAAAVMMAGALLIRRKLLEAIPRGASADERAARYQTAVITTLAMIEGPGLLILVLSLVANAPNWIPAGTAVTILMMAIARPRRDEIETTR